MINHFIHQIWWDGFNNLPERFQGNVRSVIEKNPTWIHMKWDEKSIRELMSREGPQYLAKLDEFKLLHQKIDLARFFLLHYYGGVSVDTDIVAIRGFENTPHISTSDFIVSKNSSNGLENLVKNGNLESLNNATILVSKNNPIMKGLLDRTLELSCEINQGKESCIQSTTGPKAFTEYLNKYRDKITVLDNVYFEPCSGSDEYCEINPEVSILDHQHEGSWVSDSNKRIAKVWYWIKARQSAIFSILIIIILIVIISKQNTN